MNGDELPHGARLNQFQIDGEPLGAGGFGITYRARDGNLGRTVAIKEYLPRDSAWRDPEGTVGPRSVALGDDYEWGLKKFLEEAQVLARLSHRAIVQVYEVIPRDGTAYIVMEHVEGRTLAKELRNKGLLGESQVRRLLEELTSGLEEVHDAGLLHRDIKPENVMLRQGDDSAVLIDFGAARRAGRQSRSTRALVTPGYAPVEQYSEDPSRQGPWTDIYALGAVAYVALSGEEPPEATVRIFSDELEPLTRVAAQPVSTELATAVHRALAVGHEDRPPDLTEWQKLLAPSDHSSPVPQHYPPVLSPLDPTPGGPTVVPAHRTATSRAAPAPVQASLSDDRYPTVEPDREPTEEPDRPSGPRPRWPYGPVAAVVALALVALAVIVLWPFRDVQPVDAPDEEASLASLAANTGGSRSDPPRTTPAADPPRTSPAADPPRTTPAADPPRTTPAADPPRTTPAADPPRTTPAADPPRTSPAADPPRTTPAADPPRTTPAADPPRTTPAADPPRTTPAADPPRTSPAADPLRTSPAADPPTRRRPQTRTTPAADPPARRRPPPRTAPAVDPPRTTTPAADPPPVRPDPMAERAAALLAEARQGGAQAQVDVALLYAGGNGIEQSYADALRWLQEAAGNDQPDAAMHLALMYAAGEGVPDNRDQGLYWFREFLQLSGHGGIPPSGQFDALHAETAAAYGDLTRDYLRQWHPTLNTSDELSPRGADPNGVFSRDAAALRTAFRRRADDVRNRRAGWTPPGAVRGELGVGAMAQRQRMPNLRRDALGYLVDGMRDAMNRDSATGGDSFESALEAIDAHSDAFDDLVRNLPFRTGVLKVDAEPENAIVFIDGTRYGTVDYMGDGQGQLVVAGQRTVRVSRDGYRAHEETIDIRPRERYLIRGNLERAR